MAVVEYLPAMQVTRVRFPVDANYFIFHFMISFCFFWDLCVFMIISAEATTTTKVTYTVSSRQLTEFTITEIRF